MPHNTDINGSVSDIPEPIWLPNQRTIERTHIAAAMKARGFETYEQLFEWSVAQPEEFWTYVLDTLHIEFDHPPRKVLDLTLGPTSPDWLPDAKFNIAESCFTSEADACAVVEGSQDGSLREFTYAQLRRLANRVARGLRAHGIRDGQAVAVFMPMTAESVAVYLGIVLAGCTLVDQFEEEEFTLSP